jgi:hypothetical protein
MLLRIAPQMFTNSQFECTTIRNIYDELIRTTKFKTKYPWVRDMRSQIKSLPLSVSDSAETKLNLEAVLAIYEEGAINPRTNKLFDLSKEDRQLIACAAANDYAISSGDRDLREFAVQYFDIPITSPIELINSWIEKKLIVWDAGKNEMLKLWAVQNEHPQPPRAKTRFKELTSYKYEGS